MVGLDDRRYKRGMFGISLDENWVRTKKNFRKTGINMLEGCKATLILSIESNQVGTIGPMRDAPIRTTRSLETHNRSMVLERINEVRGVRSKHYLPVRVTRKLIQMPLRRPCSNRMQRVLWLIYKKKITWECRIVVTYRNRPTCIMSTQFCLQLLNFTVLSGNILTFLLFFGFTVFNAFQQRIAIFSSQFTIPAEFVMYLHHRPK
ncbi:hypothetical protein RB24_11060 [Herbaspirillum rubrisubalbicans]|uniref:Uncharacterized protein n=1 Tax=Herbaspirillum rubrisubalbicans TaxID=80842 RepID=A0ABX9C2M3_9BURK|nr:hypothetical protein RB24_11060 [Herbaspirillum rubrisubalbicans]